MAFFPKLVNPMRVHGHKRPAALGAFFGGPRPYGFAAAPTRPGRVHGGGVTPALHGLFRAGTAVGVSHINAMATNISRGKG